MEKIHNGYQVDLKLKKNITFFVHNIMNTLSADKYDLIFFRNAFIYFSQHYRSLILDNLTAALRENGILIAGVSETAGISHENLVQINENDLFYFRKKPVYIKE